MLFCTSESLRTSENVKQQQQTNRQKNPAQTNNNEKQENPQNLIGKDDLYFWLRWNDVFLQSILKTSSIPMYACKLPITE